MADAHAPRPPEGDWMGTPYLRFERRDSKEDDAFKERRKPDWVPEDLRTKGRL